MKRTQGITRIATLMIVVVLVYAMVSSASAQSKRRYEEHEVIDIGNGMKIEVLKYRGEGESEECNVIYYTDKRQNGKRVWEKTGKIIEMERAAKLAAAQAAPPLKKTLEPPIESTSTRDAEAINLAEEKRQQDELLKANSAAMPKAVMKPKTSDTVKAKTKIVSGKSSDKTKTTYKLKNGNLITAATQMLAANGASTSPKVVTKKPVDTAKTTVKNNQPVKPNVGTAVKRDSVQNAVAARKTLPTRTSLHADTSKIVRAKPIQPTNQKLKTEVIKDSLQTAVAAKKTLPTKTTLHADTSKIVKAKPIQPTNQKSKTEVIKDSTQTAIAAKKASSTKTSLHADTSKIVKAKPIQPTNQKLNKGVIKDSTQKVSAKNTIVKRSPLPDTAKIAKNKTIQPTKEKPVASAKKDSLPNVAATKKMAAVKTSSSIDTAKGNKVMSTVSNQPAKAILPLNNKAVKVDDKATITKPSTSLSTTSVSTANNKSSKNIATPKDSIAQKTLSVKPAVTSTALSNTSKPASFAANNTTAAKGINASKSIAANKKFVFDSVTAIRIAVFAPLYIDDAFVGGMYNLGKANLPKNILAGLEFYNGVMMAVDSLSAEGVNAEVMIYDTRKTAKPLSDVLSSAELNNVGLVIANITNTAELKLFSQFAAKKNIPLISATYPNTVGVVDNPFFVLLNSSFPVHLDGLYKHMQRFYITDNIIAVRRAGTTEDFIKNYITDLNKNNRTPLNIKWIDLKENFTLNDVTKNLDSTKNNVVFVASPNEAFGLRVVRTLNMNVSYRTTAIGMPTWDAIKELNGKDCSNVEIVYSTPFVYTSQNISLSTGLVKKYRDKYYSRPSDMAFKGFETAYHFTKLLSKYQSNLVNNLSDKAFTLFNQFDIQPVKVRKSSTRPDYLENKKLYFIKKQEGSIKTIM